MLPKLTSSFQESASQCLSLFSPRIVALINFWLDILRLWFFCRSQTRNGLELKCSSDVWIKKLYGIIKVCCSYLLFVLICCNTATCMIYFRFIVAFESVQYELMINKNTYIILCIVLYWDTLKYAQVCQRKRNYWKSKIMI